MNTESENKSSGKTKFSTVKRIFIYGFVVFVVLIIAGLIFAPSMARKYINKNGKELVGRTVQIDELRYNFFTSTLSVYGFRYFEKNDTDVFMAFDTFMVNMKPLKLLNDEIYVQQLQLVNSTANIIQNDTLFNFDDLITFFNSSESTKIESESDNSKSFKLNLNNLELKNGALLYTDVQIDHTMKIEEVSFVIPSIVWSRRDSSKADIEFKLANGGDFAGSLNYNADAGEYTGFVQIEKMELLTFLPYVKQNLRVSNLDGTISGIMNFSGLVEDVYQFEMHGNFELDSLALFDDKNQKVIGGERSRFILKKSKPLIYEVIIDTAQ
ncbi:MAG TPA: DUF748 domain-containing protein, partial [Draconibacterium sp.]|nr:DUF748 domain-containing protein [Draconibacterium sp.]